MKRRRISTGRQSRTLVIPKPARKGNIKVPREGWLNCARVALIEDGIDGVKVDRLAKRLKISRGGFYHHFKNLHQLLNELLVVWKTQNRFTPAKVEASSPEAAAKAFERITDDLIHENGFDSQFDMAVREWARISHPAADVVHAVDNERVEILKEIFVGFGYPAREALIRARIFYWHQIGYYAVGFRESLKEREGNVRIYLDVLAGDKYQAARGA
ncbi:MAG TPA: TetR/AcrR family transcriptional regulator [Nevskiaceae bacterium]|nr:TetR/AcrR family transcriptional regulator [Nevskiaceae bacterium]